MKYISNIKKQVQSSLLLHVSKMCKFKNEIGEKTLGLEFKTNQTQLKHKITKRSQNVIK